MPTPEITIPSPELAAILDRIRLRLLELPPDALHAAGIAANTSVAKSFDKKGVRKDPIAFAEKFKNGSAAVKALKTGSLAFLECALWVLEIVDRKHALDEAIAIRALPPPNQTFKYEYERIHSFEVIVRERALHVVSRCMDLLPARSVVELAGRGDILVSLAGQALAKHPGLQEGDAVVTALQATRWVATPADATGHAPDRGLAIHLLGTLGALSFEAAIPALAELFRGASPHDVRWRIAMTLEALGSTLPQETLAAAVADGTLEDDGPINAQGERRWPPLLRWAVAAVFSAAPKTAYDRLIRYLDHPCLTEAFVTHGLITTVPDAIAAVLEPRRAVRSGRILHMHDGDVSGRIAQLEHPDKFVEAEAGKAGLYEADPRWAALVERMAAADPLWERYGWRFQDLAPGDLLTKMAAWTRRQKRRVAEAKKDRKA